MADRRPKRLARLAARVLIGLAVAILVLAALLSTPWGERWALRGLIAVARSRGVTLTAGDLELYPWRLSARLDRIEVTLPSAGDGGVAATLGAESLEAHLRADRRLELALEAPTLTVRTGTGEGAATAGPVIGELLESARIGAATVERGEIRLLDAEGGEITALAEVQLTLERAGAGRFPLRGSARGRQRVAPERTLDAGTLSVVAEIAGAEIRIEEAKLEREGADLVLRGALRQSATMEGALDADFRVAAGLLAEVLPELHASGELEGQARLSLAPEGLAVEADLRGAALSWDAFGPFDVGGLLRLADRQLEVREATVSGYGGRAELEGDWDLDTDRQRLAAAWTDVDAVALASAFDGPPLPPRSRTSGSAEIATTGFALEALDGEARVGLQAPGAGGGAPLAVSARGRFDRGAVNLDQARATSGTATLDAAGRIGRDGGLDGAFRLRLDDLARLGETTSTLGVPAPPVELAGGLTANGEATGDLGRPRLQARMDPQTIELEGRPLEVEAAVSADRSALEVGRLEARTGEGSIRLDGTLGWTGKVPLALRLEIESIDLCALVRADLTAACGVLDASGEIGGTVDRPRWALDGQVSDLRSRQQGEEQQPPGLLRFSARQEDGRITLDELRGVLDGGGIEASGSFELGTRELAASLRVDGLALASVVPREFPWSDLEGSVDLEARVEGPLDTPRGEGRLVLRELAFDRRQLPRVDATITAIGDGDVGIEARAGGRAEPFFTGRLELESPYPFQADAILGELPPGTIVDLLHDLPRRIESPELAGHIAIDGQLTDDYALHVFGQVERMAASYGNLRIAAAPWSLAGDADGLHIDSLRLVSDGHAVEVAGTVPLGSARQLDLDATGDVPLQLFGTPELTLGGSARVDVRVHGPLSEPQVSGTAGADDVSGGYGQVHWSGVAMRLRFAEHRVFLESASGAILGGRFEARGELGLAAPLEDSSMEIVVDVRGVDLAQLAPPATGAARPHFLVDADATLRWERLDRGAVSGRVDQIAIRAGTDGNEMANSVPARVEIESGRATLAKTRLVGGGTDLQIEGSTALAAPASELDAQVVGTVDFEQLGFLAASLPGLQIGGRGDLDLRIDHGPAGFELDGGGAISGGRIASARPRFVVSDLAGEVAFRGSAIRLRGIKGNLGGGTVEVHASIDLRDLTRLESVVLEAEAREVNLTFGEGVRARFSGDAVFQGRGDRYRLRGDLRILSGLFTREIEASTPEQEFLADIRTELGEAEVAPFADRVELQVRLATTGDIHVDNELTRVAAGGNLRVEGTLAHPELTGLVTNAGDGMLRLGRNVFNLELARITLDGYPAQPPYIEVNATTEVSGHSIRLALEGTPDDVVTTLSTTDTGLTQGDLASLLTSGRTADETGGAGGLIESRAATYLGELFQEQLGLGLVFDTAATLPILSSETGPESRFTVGRRLTRDLTLAYSVSVDEAESELWILDYHPLERLWFRAIEEAGQAYTFEVAHRLSFGGNASQPAPKRIGQVEVVPAAGAAPLPPLELPKKLQTGRRYDYWRAEDGADSLRRQLAADGHLEAEVEVKARVEENGDTAISFVTSPGPLVRFHWTGDDPGEKLRRRLESGWSGLLSPGLRVAELATEARHQLEAQRWYQAKVFGSVSDDDQGRVVELEVRLGPRGADLEVVFEGNEALDDDALRSALPPTTSPRFFAAVREDPKRIEDMLALRYAEEGYLDVRVGTISERLDPQSQQLVVEIPVDEGQRFTVAAIEFSGADSLPEETRLERIPLAVGEAFSIGQYRESGRQLRQLFREEGFPDATVRSRVRRLEQAEVAVVLEVEEGEPAVVGAIEITGRERTLESVIRRRLGFETGDPLRTTRLAAAERELYRLGVFRSVEVTAQQAQPGTRARNVTVRVLEKPRLAFDYGLRYRTDDVETLQPTIDEIKTKGLEGVVRTHLLQPFRRADSAILSVFLGDSRQRARLGYQIPSVFGQGVPTELSIESGTETRELLDVRYRTSSDLFTVQQRRSLGEHTRLLYGAQWVRGRFEPPSDAGAREAAPRSEWIYRNRLTASVVHDRRDQVMNPRSGWITTGTLQGGAPAIGADATFARVYGQFSLFVPLGRSPRSPVWASSYRAGGIWSDDRSDNPLLDLDDRFTAGGPFSVRGFEPNTLGPIFPPVIGIPVGGRGIVIVNQELRFPILGDLWGGLFYDTGNVFLRVEDLSLGDLRESYGLGLRYDVGFGVIRLDYGRLMDPRPGESSDRLHLSFGHAF